jgi:hypothetical protein
MCDDAGSVTMELAKSLVENVNFGDAERVWEKLNATPVTACVGDNADFFSQAEPELVTIAGTRQLDLLF